MPVRRLSGQIVDASYIEQPLVSVAVLTFNRREMLRRCLKSILGGEYTNIEVLVIDDCSTDGTYEMIRQHFPSVRCIRHEQETLTGQGINEGITQTAGEIVVIVNDDNVLDKRAIAEFVRAFSTSERIAVVGPLCYYLEKPEVVMYAGARLSSLSRRSRFVGQGTDDSKAYRNLVDVDMFPNCFAIRKTLILESGLVDSWRIPFFNDDASIQLAARRRGYRIVLNPNARTWHDHPYAEQDQLRVDSPFRLYYMIRSKIHLERRYDSPAGRLTFALSIPFYVMSYLAAIVRSPLPPPEKKRATQALMRGLGDGLLDRGGRGWN